MKSNPLLMVASAILMLFLACCSAQPSPAGSTSTESAEETGKLVQGWMDAYLAMDVDKFMSYYDVDVTYLNVVIKDFGTVTFDGLSKSIRTDLLEEDSGWEFLSYFVASDGTFVAIQATYHELNHSGKQVSIPITIVLEIRNGKIIRQTDYFDGGQIK